MKQLITSVLFVFTFLLSVVSVRAQQFKWVTGGGTSEDFSTAPSHESEQTNYMCTDPNGNVYALSQVGNNPIHADSFYRAAGAYGANENILLTSYNCSGQMRWAKLIANNDLGATSFGITSDNLGNVYVAGFFNTDGGIFYIGYDTTISPPASNFLMTGLIQFDTSGHFKWIRYVGANTFASASLMTNSATPITIDAANNLHYFCYMQSGVPLMPSVTSTYGVYDMTYNTGGALLSAVRLDLDSQWYLNSAVIDPVTNKLYVSGQINQDATGVGVTDTFYAAAFDASRHLLWQYFCGHGDDDDIAGVVLDSSKHLYFCGAAGPYSGLTTFSFHGDSVSSPFDVLAIIMKTDTNGNVDWFRHYDSHTSVNGFISLTLLPNNKIAAVGGYAGTVTDGTVSLPTAAGQDPYFVIVDSEGALQTIQQILGDGFYDGANAITSDKIGSIYVGGYVEDSIWDTPPPIPAYHTVGGNTDFFVMKYGYDCSCTTAPTAAFTDTGTHTIGATYTGTTTGLDSVVWNFGDGATTTSIPPLTGAVHTYSASGTYNVCVTAYTECGSDEHCGNVVVHIHTAGLVGINSSNVNVYPNPANDELNVTGLNGNANYRLLNVTGVGVLNGAIRSGSNSISMQNVAPGVYVLELVSEDGERNMVRVVKE